MPPHSKTCTSSGSEETDDARRARARAWCRLDGPVSGLRGGLHLVAGRTAGVGRVRRPAGDDSPEFDLTYVRVGPRTAAPPLVVVPGGPGLASVLPYRTLRRRAARLGLEVIMVEHRGVGLSRTGLDGRDLPTSAMRIRSVVDDIAAVLDHESIDRALLVGSSYGSYLASCFGALHPERVSGMLLDSALQSADDIDLERQAIRSGFWAADTAIAADVRHLHAGGLDDRRLLDVVRAAYELGGDELLGPLLRERRRSPLAPTWRILEAYAARDDSIVRVPGVYEFDLAGVIGFRELGYGGVPDGLPLDPALTYGPLAPAFPAFDSEPVDLSRAVREFDWPLVLLSGRRDLRTPPAIAERVAAASPDATLVRIENGHSALETHPEALLATAAALASGAHRRLAQRPSAVGDLPRRGFTARSPDLLALVLRAETAMRRR